jgi:uncharacterized membrane protein YeaQ/YmgE (transglycosylase-associated protein family)
MPPWLVFAAVLALALAALYQLAMRRYGWRVIGYWAVILLGILGAEALAESLGWSITRFGDLRLLPDLVGALLVLALLWFLGI